MLHDFFEHLRKRGILNPEGKLVPATVMSLRGAQLVDLAERAHQETVAADPTPAAHIRTHTASLSLAGGAFPCSGLECRIKKVRELSAFALLYSDRVYTKDFLSDYIDPNKKKLSDSNEFKEAFLSDLIILVYLKPLIAAGFVRPFSTSKNFCPHCLAKMNFGNDAAKRSRREFKRLSNEFFKKVSLTLRKRGNEYRVAYTGPEELLPHGGGSAGRTELPPEVASMKRLIERLNRGEQIPVSREVKKKLNLHDYLARQTFQNVRFDLTTSQVTRTTFLTDSELHVQVLDSLSHNESVERRNQLASQYMTSLVPLAPNLDINEVIALREREEEAFLVYRKALERAISSYKSEGHSLDAKSARNIYSDVLAPELAKLQRKVDIAKKDLVKASTRTAIAYVGAISFGSYFGLLPNELVKAASALGATGLIAKGAYDLMGGSDVERTIENEEMYFLWKVQKLGEKAKPN